MTVHNEIIQAIVATSLSVTAYIVGQIENSVPGWVRDYGVPIVMLAGAVWALVAVFKELSRERAARIADQVANTKDRIADRDLFIEIMRAETAQSTVQREALIRATIDQTNEFKALRHDINRKLRITESGE